MTSLHIKFGGEDFTFLTEPSLFSPNQLDGGSRFLLESLPVPLTAKNILDLGSGWGAMGIILAKLDPDSFVYLLDNDPKALFCAQKNLALNNIKNAKVFKGDVSYTTMSRKFDLIISNPPWTKNVTVVPELIEFAKKHLEADGIFYLVINQTFRTHDQLERIFGNSKIVAQVAPYKVISAHAPEIDPNDLLEWTKDTLTKNKIIPFPLKGQHFLTDSAIVERVVQLADLKKSDTVLEIGPGLGTLTSDIAKKAGKVVAVEIDPRFKPVLGRMSKNVSVLYGDFFDIFRPKKQPFKFNKVVSSLPYFAAGSILEKLARRNFNSAVLILPSKLAGKLGESNLKDYFAVEKSFPISRVFFYPMPETNSTVVKIRKI